jgi:hypothetical protein
VVLSHSVDTTQGTGWIRPNDTKDPTDLRIKIIAERVGREGPMPQAAADREQLVRRVTLDIVGEAPSAEEVAAFVADNAPDALVKLAARLQARPRIEPFSGTLPTGQTKFRVTAADPDAATKPRVANSPGRYVLGDHVRLLVSQSTTEGRRTNKAIIAFLSSDPTVPSPHKQHEISLPEGFRGWAAVWQRGSGELWVIQEGLVRKYEFGDPTHVKETRFEPGTIDNLPENLRKAYVHETAREAFADLPPTAATDEPQPNNKDAKALIEVWRRDARKNGDIPGGLVARLGDKVKEFVRANTGDASGDPYAKKMAPLLPRFEAVGDWKLAEVGKLLDDIAAVSTIPLDVTREEAANRTFRTGEPLPKELAKAPWGEAQGLRI